jgi:formylglycine-generating enzyme required for sulfatase activity
MAQIPAGCFDMGDHFGEGDDDELPVHNVCISAFEMDLHEVTNAEYAACVDDGGCTPPTVTGSQTRATYYGDPAYDDFPVIWVEWYHAEHYCTWAGKRLPTEAEWEYAARGGLDGKRYPWGDTISGSDANYWGSGDPWDNDTSEVEYYAPNGYGLYDMAGNVWEWVNDYYGDYYDVSPPNDPPGPATGFKRILRGGSWSYDTDGLRVANRFAYTPDDQDLFIGFRCARGGAYGP